MEVESVPDRGMMVLKGGVCRRLCDVSEGRAEKEKKSTETGCRLVGNSIQILSTNT